MASSAQSPATAAGVITVPNLPASVASVASHASPYSVKMLGNWMYVIAALLFAGIVGLLIYLFSGEKKEKNGGNVLAPDVVMPSVPSVPSVLMHNTPAPAPTGLMAWMKW